MNRLEQYARAHENDRDVGVLAPGRTVHGLYRSLIEQEPVGLLDDINVPGADKVVIVADRCHNRIGLLSRQSAGRHGKRNAFHFFSKNFESDTFY